MSEPLFQVSNVVVCVAGHDDTEALGQFCRTNPDYDIFLTGEVPDVDEWTTDFLTDVPPQEFGWTATYKLIALSPDRDDEIVAIMDVTLDMIARGVGHIGLFQVAQKLYGTGFAHNLYRSLEDWLEGQGMIVLRLGVLEGNPRGMAFWTRHGYCETRQRTGVAPTGKQHQSYVMYKPLKALSLDAYRKLVPRDHPDTP
jgi:GNAT superfamily N-acetyltransferase